MGSIRTDVRFRACGVVALGLLTASSIGGCTNPDAKASALTAAPYRASAAIASPSSLTSVAHGKVIEFVAYDHFKPFDVRERSAVRQEGSTVHDITYAGLEGDRWQANLVVPDGPGPFPAAMYLHGAGGSSSSFLTEAAAIAKHGVASLLITQPELLRLLTTDQEAWTEIVFEMREMQRSLDLLASRPKIDSARLGFVGRSFGAVRGTTFSGIAGSRLKIAVIMSTPPSYNAPALAAFDPIAWAPHISPAAFYLQEGNQDTWFTHAEGESLIAAAREPKTLVWYDANHGLNQQAMDDRVGWLVAALGGR